MKLLLGIIFAITLLGQLPSMVLETNAITTSTLGIQLHFAPSAVEFGHKKYPIGYVSIVDNDGNPVFAGHDVVIQLSSGDPTIATVPANVTIHKKSSFANFDVDTNNDGDVLISAQLNNQQATEKLLVGKMPIQLPPDTQLVFNMPSQSMNVNTNSIFSVFLESNNTILKAPYDIDVSTDYDRNLIKLNDTLTIKEGNYYSIGTITTFGKTGNAYMKATTNNPNLVNITSVKISSTAPALLRIYVLPRNITYSETHFGVFVGLFDQDGNPTKAENDIKLKFFTNHTKLDTEMAKQLAQRYDDGIIKQNQFGFYKLFQYVFTNPENYTIGVSAPGLGIDNATLTTTQAIAGESVKSYQPYIKVQTIPFMPNNSSAIMVYQILSKAQNLDKNEVDLKKGRSYPTIAKQNYSTEPAFDNLQLVSSNNKLISIKTPAYLLGGSSFGTAIISSGQISGNGTMSAVLQGIGGGENYTLISSSSELAASKFFSPIGDKIIFNDDGNFSLYLSLLDSKGRPIGVKDEKQFLIKPLNTLVSIPSKVTYQEADLTQELFPHKLGNSVSLSAEQIGTNIDSSKDTSSTFNLSQLSGSLQLYSGIQNFVSKNRENDVGAVQLLDSYGNPSHSSEDVIINLSTNSTNIKVPSTVKITKGNSFAQFPIITSDKGTYGVITATALQYNPANLGVSIVPSVQKIFMDVNYPLTIPLKTAVEVNVTLTDQYGDPIPASRIDLAPYQNSTVNPPRPITDENGVAYFLFSADSGPKSLLTVTAATDGYIPASKSIIFDVNDTESKITSAAKTTGNEFILPAWGLYLIVGVFIVGVGAPVFILLRRSKKVIKPVDEDAIFEDEYAEDI